MHESRRHGETLGLRIEAGRFPAAWSRPIMRSSVQLSTNLIVRPVIRICSQRGRSAELSMMGQIVPQDKWLSTFAIVLLSMC